LPPKVSPRIVEVVMRCLQRDPARRPGPLELFDLFDDLAADRDRRRRLRQRCSV
jgi:hypothetical protein